MLKIELKRGLKREGSRERAQERAQKREVPKASLLFPKVRFLGISNVPFYEVSCKYTGLLLVLSGNKKYSSMCTTFI